MGGIVIAEPVISKLLPNNLYLSLAQIQVIKVLLSTLENILKTE